MLGLLLALATAAQAQLAPANWKPIVIDKWGGWNLSSDSTQIGYDSQDCQNVMTENGYLEKRPGNTLLATILPGYPITYCSEWLSPSGTRYLIAQASQTVYKTDLSPLPVASLSSVPSGYRITTTSQFSKLFFADGATPLWYWDGNSTGTVTDPSTGVTAPICTYLESQDSRLWCANSPNSGGAAVGPNVFAGSIGDSSVFISSAGGYGDWYVPYNVAQVLGAPNFLTFGIGDGDYITCIKSTPFGMFVGKQRSTYRVLGYNNATYRVVQLDPHVGCTDNRSVQMVGGVLEWLALDGVYGYNGAGQPQPISRELDPLFPKLIQSKFAVGSWKTTLSSDWGSGTTLPATSGKPPTTWDYQSQSGLIFPSSFTLFDDNRGASQVGTVGFASDTLVNIDTVSVPLSIGYAQLASGSAIWSSSFPAGNYTTIPTTWTVAAGAVTNWCPNSWCVPNSISAGFGMTGVNAVIYISSTIGHNSGQWSIQWMPLYIRTSNIYGECWSSAGTECLEFNFMSDKPSGLWNGYGLGVVQGACDASNCQYAVNLYSETLGVETVLKTTNISLPVSSSYVGFSTFTVRLQPTGLFTVSLGSSPIFNYTDSTAKSPANYTSVVLTSVNGVVGGHAAVGYNFISSVTMSGTYAPSGTITSKIYDTAQSTPLAGVLTVIGSSDTAGQTSLGFSLRSSTSPHNDMWQPWQTSAGSFVALPYRYWQVGSTFTTTVASMTPTLTSYSLKAVTTGQYVSKVDYVGTDITAWGQFAVNVNAGLPTAYTYYFRSSLIPFLASAPSPPWAAQLAGQNITASTGACAQFKMDSSGLANADDAISINGVTVNWDKGEHIPTASAMLDRRYLLCVAISSATHALDTCLLRQKTGKWIPWRGPIVGAAGIYDNNIVVGDGATSGAIWKILQPGIFSDAGFPIDAYWISGDFTDGIPFNGKVLHEMWGDFAAVSMSSATVGYAVDKSSNWIDKTISLYAPGAPPSTAWPLITPQYAKLNQWIPLMSGYANGRYIRYRIRDNFPASYTRLNTMLLYIEDQQRMVP